jgi:hypothetical protein
VLFQYGAAYLTSYCTAAGSQAVQQNVAVPGSRPTAQQLPTLVRMGAPCTQQHYAFFGVPETWMVMHHPASDLS